MHSMYTYFLIAIFSHVIKCIENKSNRYLDIWRFSIGLAICLHFSVTASIV